MQSRFSSLDCLRLVRRLAPQAAVLCGCALAVPLAACFTASPDSGLATPSGSGPQGCVPADGGIPPIADGGYYTNGAQVCTASGQPHVFHGVDRPSLEWMHTGDSISYCDFKKMASWHANVVRIALNQDFWLSGAIHTNDPGYPARVQNAVTWAEQAGLDVILDLHWSDRGDLTVPQAGGTLPNSTKYVPSDTPGYSVQQPMADANSVEFWKEVATTFKDDGHVMFELYNEPNGISWNVWLNGGMVQGFEAHGMQELYDTVRSTGANNIVIVGGINWAFDLSGVKNNPVRGYNIMYATHPYKSNDSEGQWASSFEYLMTSNFAPVIATEFGDSTPNTCTGKWDTDLLAVAAKPNLQMSWTAWAWYPGDPCQFPALIDSFTAYAPTNQGMVIHDALASDPEPQPWIPGGGSCDADASVGAAVDAAGDAAHHEGGSTEAGVDAGNDASAPDATAADGSAPDAAAPDASGTDAGASSDGEADASAD